MRIYYFTLISLCLLAAIKSSIAQESEQEFKKRIYKTRLFSNDSLITKGFLTGISDSSILISSQKQRFGIMTKAEGTVKNIHYSRIPDLIVKRKGNASKGFWIGALSGMTIGILVGTIEDRHTQSTGDLNIGGSSGGLYGFLGFTGGGLLGLIISSSFRKTFVIGGKKEEFDTMKATVLEMTYRKSKGN